MWNGVMGTWPAKMKHWMGPISRELCKKVLGPALLMQVCWGGHCWSTDICVNITDTDLCSEKSLSCYWPSNVSENTKDRAPELLGNWMKTKGTLESSSQGGCRCLSNQVALSCPQVSWYHRLCQAAWELNMKLLSQLLQSFLLSKWKNFIFAPAQQVFVSV